MSANLVRIANALRILRPQLKAAQDNLEKARSSLQAARNMLGKAPDSTVREALQKAERDFASHSKMVASLEEQIRDLVKQQMAEAAVEGGGAAGRGTLWRIASWVGQRVGLGAAGGTVIILVTAGAVTYAVAVTAGRLAADDSVGYGQKVTNRPAGEKLTSGGLEPPTPETRKFTTYKLVEAYIRKLPATTVVPIETFESSVPASVELKVEEPAYTSTGTLKITAPPTVNGDTDKVTFAATMAVTFDLKQGTHNLNTSVNVLGGGQHEALPKTEGGWLAAGSHSLEAKTSVTTDFASHGFVRKWEEDGVLCRSVTIAAHTGIVQRLSGCEVRLTYKQQRGSLP